MTFLEIHFCDLWQILDNLLSKVKCFILFSMILMVLPSASDLDKLFA